MRTFRNSFILGAAMISSSIMAVEGMWQPEQLPLISKDLKAKGLKTSPHALDDLTNYPMNAIVSLGGCSASFVSPQGLVVTNHHCAYGSIQYNSTEKRNLLSDGFIAKNRTEELQAAPGSRILVTETISDITSQILEGLEGIDGLDRYEKIEGRRKQMIRACEQQKGYRCRIDSFLGSSSYRLTKQLEIKDVRLVQAPPSSIGKFGGDIDNWMWPRHTGDFAFYRAYVDKDGKPAEFNKENVPYQPAGFLKIEPHGTQEGDFVMVAGYPGRTNRHRLAREVEGTFKDYYPRMKSYLDSRITIIEDLAKMKKEVGIAYAGKLAGFNNYSKNIEGKMEGFAALNIVADKKKIEKEFLGYLQAKKDKAGIENYRALNQLIEEEIRAEKIDMNLRLLGDSALLGQAKKLYKLAVEKQSPDKEREAGYQNRDLPLLKSRLQALSKRFDAKVDEAVWLKGLAEVDTSLEKIPEAYKILLRVSKAKRQKIVSRFYTKTKLLDEKHRIGLMAASRKELDKSKDPFIALAVQLFADEEKLADERKAMQGRFQKLRSTYMENFAAFMKSKGQVLYSDANSTLRITYGTIQGYKNRKGQKFEAYTKLEEIADKHTGKDPFDVPEKQLSLISNKNYGMHKMDSIDTVPVNFLADLDITGGNSGSATLNGKGELIGLVFDGTIDGVISDWAFDPLFTRSIHVDVRYMLWVLEKFDQDERLLQEMGINLKKISH